MKSLCLDLLAPLTVRAALHEIWTAPSPLPARRSRPVQGEYFLPHCAPELIGIAATS